VSLLPLARVHEQQDGTARDRPPMKIWNINKYAARSNGVPREEPLVSLRLWCVLQQFTVHTSVERREIMEAAPPL